MKMSISYWTLRRKGKTAFFRVEIVKKRCLSKKLKQHLSGEKKDKCLEKIKITAIVRGEMTN